MKNIKNIKLTILGIMSLCTIFALNLRHAFNNYGILDNMLHMEVLAQSNSSGGGSGSSSGGFGSGGSGSGSNSEDGPEKKYRIWDYTFDCTMALGSTEVNGKKPSCIDGDKFVNCPDCAAP
jgi:hypothetical protein